MTRTVSLLWEPFLLDLVSVVKEVPTKLSKFRERRVMLLAGDLNLNES